jgi:predicted dehydrogenase
VKQVAVVGLGKIGLLHASLLSVLPDVRLVALCEKGALIRRFSKRVFRDLRIVGNVGELSGLNLDAVFVTTPPSTHFAVVKAVCSARIAPNIFVEKPLASNAVESEELCRLVEKQAPGTNMVGYNRRFAVTFRKAKEILDEGALGAVRSFQAYAYSSDFFGVKPGSKGRTRGSALRDLGCHAVDLAMWFYGDLQVEEAKVEAAASKGTTDSAYFRARTAGGLPGEFRSSWCVENYRLPEIGLSINGSKGIMRVNDDDLELKLNNGNAYLWHRHDLNDGAAFFLGGTDYLREDEAFVRAMAGGSQVEPSFRSAAKVDQVLDQVEERARDHGR